MRASPGRLAFHHCPCLLSWLSHSQADSGEVRLTRDFPFFGGVAPISTCLLVLLTQLLTALPGLYLEPSAMSPGIGVVHFSVSVSTLGP